MSVESYPVRWAGRLAVVTAPGEIDLSNAGQLLEQLLAVLDREPAALIVDMSATTFCDSAGVNTVLRAYKRAHQQGTELRVAAPALPVQRVFTLTGLDRLIDIYPGLAASLAGRLPGRPAGPDRARTGSPAPPRPASDGPLEPPAHAGGPAGNDGH